MFRLSIIIPFLGNLKRLEDTLVSVLENRPAASQIIVVLNQSYEDPYDLEGEVTFVQAPLGAGMADCIDLGIVASESPIVHVLHSGVEATPGWVEPALAHFADAQVAAVAPVLVNRFDPSRILSAGLKYTASGAVQRIDAGKLLERFKPRASSFCGAELVAAFYRKSALEIVGRLEDRVGNHVAGADLALALRHTGFRCIIEPECLVAADREILQSASAWQEGVETEHLFWRWAPVVGWKRSLAAHAGLLVWECLQCPIRPATVCRLAGRFWASLRFGSHRRHWRWLEKPAPAPQLINPPHFIPGECRKPMQSRAAG